MWIKLERNNNYSINEQGEVRNDLTGKLKTPTLNKDNNYYYVDLYKENKRTKAPIHRLVAEAFIPNPDNKPTIDHIDGNRHNNAINNLRWATYSEQNSRFNTSGVRSQRVRAIHFIETRKKRGGGHLSWDEADKVVYFNKSADCAKYFGVTHGNISQMLKSGTIGVRGITRGWLFEYVNSERKTTKKV